VIILDTYELKKEQLKLAQKVQLADGFDRIKTIAGTDCVSLGNKLIACVVVCEFPSLKIKEQKTYLLENPLPYQEGFLAYREMPAIIEAYNQLEEEPDLILVDDAGIAHPRKIGMASHLGLALNKPTLGITKNLLLGKVESGKIMLDHDLVGFEIKTKEHANSLFVSPGHLISLGSTLNLIPKTIQFPHKLPEPIHLAHKFGKKKLGEIMKVKIPVAKVEVQNQSLDVQPCL